MVRRCIWPRVCDQGSHRLEKALNLEGCLEKALNLEGCLEKALNLDLP